VEAPRELSSESKFRASPSGWPTLSPGVGEGRGHSNTSTLVPFCCCHDPDVLQQFFPCGRKSKVSVIRLPYSPCCKRNRKEDRDNRCTAGCPTRLLNKPSEGAPPYAFFRRVGMGGWPTLSPAVGAQYLEYTALARAYPCPRRMHSRIAFVRAVASASKSRCASTYAARYLGPSATPEPCLDAFVEQLLARMLLEPRENRHT
jgi:hypothetical protein